jgi:hypothetical protein
MEYPEKKSAVEFIISRLKIMEAIDVRDVEQAKVMEIDGRHASYEYGHEVGYKKANELWEASRKAAENQPRLK